MSEAERFQRVQDLFHEAARLARSNRATFLRARCPDDESLRREVESLLAEDAAGSGVFGTATVAKEATAFALEAGARVGPYEIVSPVGAGGMGHVYRARDARLHRDVAIKVLPDYLATHPDRISRLEREARLLAAVNHPRIAAIYGVESVNGGLAVVMELVEGPTLAERMTAGPLALEEALTIARQIGDALEAAHDRGIIHRDLKPVNIKITPAGDVKVLDFGLAKVVRAENCRLDEAGSDPETVTDIGSGNILGTAAYMAPEQARGLAVDKRVDIWAFGVVLFEMITGRPLFAAGSVSDTLAAVLTAEPDWSLAPAKVRRLVRRCLEKDPKRRLRDIVDGWDLLEEAPHSGSNRKLLPWAAVAAFALTLLAVSWSAWRGAHAQARTLQPLVRVNEDLGGGVALGSLAGADAILSPDGSRLVYCSHSRLFTRRLDESTAKLLAGTDGAYAPFFSPDGQSVAFFVPGELKKVSADGGHAVTLASFAYGMGGSWGEDGEIIAAGLSSGLFRIPSQGGSATPVTQMAPGEFQHRWPQLLPDNRTILFTAFSTAPGGVPSASIEAVTKTGQRSRMIQRGATWARYLPSGHLVYFNEGTLYAVLFDLARLQTSGTAVPVLQEVAYDRQYGSAQFDSSLTGIAVYRSRSVGRLVTVQSIDAGGRMEPLLETPGEYRYMWLAPNGRRIALSNGSECWIQDCIRRTLTPWTFTRSSRASTPLWTPDGRFIVFAGVNGLLWARADGGEKAQPLTQSSNVQYAWSFTRDGKRLAFNEFNPETKGFSIWTVAVENDGTQLRAGAPEVFLQTPFNERHSSFSPDGRWIAYTSNESGIDEIYVRAFPDRGRKWQVSSGGGVYPQWSPTKPEVYFRSPDNRVMAAEYSVDRDSFEPEAPRVWLEAQLANVGIIGRNFDVGPDGRIVALMPLAGSEGQKAEDHIIFLFNFFDELLRRIPSRAAKSS